LPTLLTARIVERAVPVLLGTDNPAYPAPDPTAG
jgi:hypothetical protein